MKIIRILFSLPALALLPLLTSCDQHSDTVKTESTSPTTAVDMQIAALNKRVMDFVVVKNGKIPATATTKDIITVLTEGKQLPGFVIPESYKAEILTITFPDAMIYDPESVSFKKK